MRPSTLLVVMLSAATGVSAAIREPTPGKDPRSPGVCEPLEFDVALQLLTDAIASWVAVFLRRVQGKQQFSTALYMLWHRIDTFQVFVSGPKCQRDELPGYQSLCLYGEFLDTSVLFRRRTVLTLFAHDAEIYIGENRRAT
ncbi:hypothetical protein PCL_09729 [Purpureocillium lilacinum]|uniref:Uncharacterized protein n=1 Tax=Purpureocillium lilacinum TaxID=33203 RepID=A0A2U3EDW4_PURLI|nr:hypothetical protein Purlil1_1247 [Purpureocillium lilacinum]PWI72714.1 hypothetical protein PCL_09729 [Purpureocillium lilacinum]